MIDVSEETAKLRELVRDIEEAIPVYGEYAFASELLRQACAALRSSAERVEELQSQLSEATKPVTDEEVAATVQKLRKVYVGNETLEQSASLLERLVRGKEEAKEVGREMFRQAQAAERRCRELEKELHELNGTPAKRFRWLMAELQKRFPNPKPHMSSFSYERYALEQIDAARTGKPE
jgi:DNA repair exonuclease SbcCD ATPase subunit